MILQDDRQPSPSASAMAGSETEKPEARVFCFESRQLDSMALIENVKRIFHQQGSMTNGP